MGYNMVKSGMGGDGVFGYVTASMDELTKEEKQRYNGVYCGICRQIHHRGGQLSRLVLSYDMAFLALLLMSLYEPEEASGENACLAHPLRKSPWTQCDAVGYAADMNLALAYYKALDDRADDGKLSALAMSAVLKNSLAPIEAAWPRQCAAMKSCIAELTELETAGCDNPDLCAACFGRLMAELLVLREDLWAEELRGMGDALGSFVYLSDAAVDYWQDRKKHKYNPFLAMGMEEDYARWEQYLVLTMGRCTQHFERLPLVQDKSILDNILYAGVWSRFRSAQKRGKKEAKP